MKKILLIAPLALVAMAGTAHIYNSAENQSFNHNIRSISKANEVSEEGVFLVYFHAPEDWSNPNIWPWNNASGENPYTPIGWPGRAMNADPNNDGWYYMYVPEYVDMLIFNYTDESGTTIQTNGDPIDETLAGKNIWIDGITSEKQTDEEGVEKTVYHMATPTTEKLTSGELPEYVEERFAFARIPNDWDKAVATFTSSTDSTANYQLELALQSDKVWFGGIVDAKYDTVSINNGETDKLKESVEVKIEGSPFYVDVLDEIQVLYFNQAPFSGLKVKDILNYYKRTDLIRYQSIISKFDFSKMLDARIDFLDYDYLFYLYIFSMIFNGKKIFIIDNETLAKVSQRIVNVVEANKLNY